MMAQRRSIYSNPQLEAALAPRVRDGVAGGISGAITTMCSRYDEIVRRSLQTIRMSVAEWCLIADTCNGWFMDSPGSSNYLPHEVQDGIGLNQLDAKWQVDGPALIAKLQAMSFAELVAINDTCERFWALSGTDEDDGDAAALFGKLGVRTSPDAT